MFGMLHHEHRIKGAHVSDSSTHNQLSTDGGSGGEALCLCGSPGSCVIVCLQLIFMDSLRPFIKLFFVCDLGSVGWPLQVLLGHH